jgi:FkbM family methyltransferase
MIVHKFIARTKGFTPNVVVHVGAHKASEVERYEYLGVRRVIWIEADEDTAKQARNTLKRRPAGATEHTLVEALITDTDGDEVPFHVFSNKGGSSSIFRATDIFRAHWPDVRETGEVKVLTSSRLETVLAGLPLEPGDLDVLVIDVQGAELLCLKGAGRYLEGLAFIEVETSAEAIYDGAALAPEIDSFLTKAGFRRISDLQWHGDVVYLREDRLQEPRFARLLSA